MTYLTNPFLKQYRNTTIAKQIVVISDDGQNTVHYLPIHPQQEDISDIDLKGGTCTFDQNFVLLDSDYNTPDELYMNDNQTGTIVDVVYQLSFAQNGKGINLGHFASREEAINSLKTFYRLPTVFEINIVHLRESTVNFVINLGLSRKETSSLFMDWVFLANTLSFGFVLHGTPWDDNTLSDHGITCDQLKKKYAEFGFPFELIHIIFSAAEAGCRFLIFDPNAPVLNGLVICAWT